MATHSSTPSLFRRGGTAVWFHLRHLFSRRYRVRYQHNLKHLVADILILLAIIALIVINGYIFLVFTKWAISLQVQVSINGPAVVRSGMPVEYTITVANTARRGTVTDAVVTLDLPGTFHINQVSEGINADRQIILGTIAPRQQRNITVSGTWWSNNEQSHRVLARADYTQFSPIEETLRWQDARSSATTVTVRGSAVVCTVAAPASSVRTAYVWLTVQCHNDGVVTIDQVTLAAPELVKTGRLARSVPAAGGDDSRWLLGSLAAGAASDPVRLLVQLTGTPNQSADSLPLELRGVYADTTWMLDTPTAVITLAPSPVTVTLRVNDQEQFFPQPGETQTITLTVHNTTDQTVSDIIPVVDFSGSNIARDTVTHNPTGEWRGDWLIFPSQTLTKGESVTITIGTTIPATVAVPQHQLLAGVFQGDRNSITAPLFEQWLLMTQPFSSRLELTALARYYTRDREQIGLGPLPPLVGFPTRYRVFFEVSSDRNTIDAVDVSGTLAKNVIWDSDNCTSISAGFLFDADTRRITWHGGTITSGQSNVASFCLTVTPLTEQVGSFAPLLSDIVAIGADATTKRQLRTTNQTITTALPFDPFAAGRGKVIR